MNDTPQHSSPTWSSHPSGGLEMNGAARSEAMHARRAPAASSGEGVAYYERATCCCCYAVTRTTYSSLCNTPRYLRTYYIHADRAPTLLGHTFHFVNHECECEWIQKKKIPGNRLYRLLLLYCSSMYAAMDGYLLYAESKDLVPRKRISYYWRDLHSRTTYDSMIVSYDIIVGSIHLMRVSALGIYSQRTTSRVRRLYILA